ncbi:(Fe-S)-binding protein [Neobacillus sp. GCM10023253]|uniref:(Fe-S)-binding protein n=1 Tax=Neobacillus sp. GCM10023253 TaxID=3252644 RepID=UPI0036165AE3
MTLQQFLGLLTILLASFSIVLMLLRLRPILLAMRRSRPTYRMDQIGKRLSSMVVQVFGHKRLLRNRLAGIIHLFIFSGFVILMLDIIEAIGQVISPTFSVGVVLQAVIDLWVLLVLTGVVLAIYQRRVIRPKRYEGSDERDGEIILGMISAIMIGIVIHTSFFPLVADSLYGIDEMKDGHFLGVMLSKVWIALGLDQTNIPAIGYTIGYLMDIGIIFAFMMYLPTSKHLHVFFAVPAIFFRKMDPPGQLVSQDDSNQSLEEIKTYEDFTWKDILDLYTCTECGRCQDVCPANKAGSPLSPKMLILNLRDAHLEQLHGNKPAMNEDWVIAGNVISAETLWSCTTCGACQEACPVFIEHVPKIVGLRASLVENGLLEERAQATLEGLIDHGNVYGKDQKLRPAWAASVDYRFKDARNEKVDWLWFLGDVASFETDPGVLNSIHSVSSVFKKADLNVGLLFNSEVSSGNDALRMGEIGLFEQLANQNMASLKEANFDRILTTDPHSFNALANDYQKLGLDKPVYHYSQVFLELFNEGRLSVESPLGIRATYHDPCYIGRWNGIFEQPREVLNRCGVEVVDMPRNRGGSLCCGAGGGRMWMNESGVQERPSESRIKEALTLPEVTHFVVSCPKDMVMYTAAVASLGVGDQIKVVDISELVLMAVNANAVQAAVS